MRGADIPPRFRGGFVRFPEIEGDIYDAPTVYHLGPDSPQTVGPDSTRIFEFYVDVRRSSYPNVIGIWDMELEAPRRRE